MNRWRKINFSTKAQESHFFSQRKNANLKCDKERERKTSLILIDSADQKGKIWLDAQFFFFKKTAVCGFCVCVCVSVSVCLCVRLGVSLTVSVCGVCTACSGNGMVWCGVVWCGVLVASGWCGVVCVCALDVLCGCSVCSQCAVWCGVCVGSVSTKH